MKPPPIGIADLFLAVVIVLCIVAPMAIHWWHTCWGECL